MRGSRVGDKVFANVEDFTSAHIRNELVQIRMNYARNTITLNTSMLNGTCAFRKFKLKIFHAYDDYYRRV